MTDYLPEAVESVVSQDYEPIELIVVDDGSREKITKDKITNSNKIDLKLIEIEHGGKPVAVNRGFDEATGEYLIILDADDQLPGQSLSQRVNNLQTHQADLCIGSFEVRYNEETQSRRLLSDISHKSDKHIIRSLLTRILTPFHQNAMMFSRELLDRVGKMDPAMQRGQDKDFAIRLLRVSNNEVFIDDSVYIYNRYDRPLSRRLYNRCAGIKYKLIIIDRHTEGWRKGVYMVWNTIVETAKLIHDLFGVYKK
jgi:glycosyltransferase involved in cell wall biosynthesis